MNRTVVITFLVLLVAASPAHAKGVVSATVCGADACREVDQGREIVLFTESEEFGPTRGLDVVRGRVRRFPAGPKVPHMGWNRVHHAGDLPLFDGIPSGAYFYFVHSYYPALAETSLAVATCDYGVPFGAAVGRGRVFGTQFHPEKSQRWGVRMLENFARVVRGSRA